MGGLFGGRDDQQFVAGFEYVVRPEDPDEFRVKTDRGTLVIQLLSLDLGVGETFRIPHVVRVEGFKARKDRPSRLNRDEYPMEGEVR